MDGSGQPRPTQMQHLADLAGVSRATVSRALSGSPRVNKRTRDKIIALAREHNYKVNQKARNFRLQRTGVVSVVFMLDTSSPQHMSDPFFLEMLGGIADTLADHDLDLLLSHGPIPDIGALASSRLTQNSDGLIFIGQGVQHRTLNHLFSSGLRMVVWGAPLPDQRYSQVGGDNVQGGYLATRHLLDQGRRRIAFFGNIEQPEITLRYQGYQRALQEAGVAADPALTVAVPYELQRARLAISDRLRGGPTFDAALCTSDVMALGAIATITAAGLSVPEDIALVGYDDIALARYATPSLTTVRQDIRGAGRVLVERLLALIAGGPVVHTTMPSRLVVRQSCGAAGLQG